MSLPDLYIDADACPVKDEAYRVAQRYGLRVFVVSNSYMRLPHDERIELVVVTDGFDAADDWIAERVTECDIVVTADIPLAGRCLEKKAAVLGTRGKEFTEDAIGDALATRELMQQLRDMGEVSGGPPPFDRKDRSRFLQMLDNLVQAAMRRNA